MKSFNTKHSKLNFVVGGILNTNKKIIKINNERKKQNNAFLLQYITYAPIADEKLYSSFDLGLSNYATKRREIVKSNIKAATTANTAYMIIDKKTGEASRITSNQLKAKYINDIISVRARHENKTPDNLLVNKTLNELNNSKKYFNLYGDEKLQGGVNLNENQVLIPTSKINEYINGSNSTSNTPPALEIEP